MSEAKKYSFYDLRTGLIHGARFSANTHADHEQQAQLNRPSGYGLIEGHFDPLSQRVDIETGAVVDYQPPQPSAQHEWDAAAKRWRLTASHSRALAADAAARARIAELEAAQARPLRELALEPKDAAALLRLAGIEQEIRQCRAHLQLPAT